MKESEGKKVRIIFRLMQNSATLGAIQSMNIMEYNKEFNKREKKRPKRIETSFVI